ncbi:uncharacterized protein GIQ15_00694 [Arthroderma uncinatum]|uniref:uncharacterized protein n=1 Tax=Arthroderma uncinatum TaxID=74035 RepID=UPI00144A874B|nr:uncharacterized protein GIQ15_00694 [Arthroderma uncinatum]KAF3491177.1 hypothetical protein GIQ15_00694 [Arthroderma uncinatum]
MSLREREYRYYYEDDDDEDDDQEIISPLSGTRSSNAGSYSIKRYVIVPDSQPRSRRRDSGSERLPRRLNTMERRQEYEYVDIDHDSNEYRTAYRGSATYSPHDDHEYQIVRHSADDIEDRTVVHRAPHEDDYWYERRIREYDSGPRDHDDHYSDRYSDSRSSIGHHRHRHRRDREYGSDDEHDHRRRHMAEGALAGVGAAELWRRNSRKDKEKEHSGTLSRITTDLGAGAVGAYAVEAISKHRSKSRRRADSLDRGRDREHYRHRHRYHSRHHRSRSRHGRSRSRHHRSRSSSSHSHTKAMAGLGIGAAAIAGAVALAHKHAESKAEKEKALKTEKYRGRKSHSRRRRGRRHSQSPYSYSSDSGDSERRKKKSAEHRNKRMAEAGLAGATVAGLVEHARSKSRSRKGHRSRSRSHSRIRQGIPIAAAGLGSAAIAAMYESNKQKKADKKYESEKEERRQSRSRRRRSHSGSSYTDVDRGMGRLNINDDPRNPHPELIQYGGDPVYGRIPAADYYGRPDQPRLEDSPRRRRSRHHSRHDSYSDSSEYDGSDSDERRRRRKDRKNRRRSHSRGDHGNGNLATGLAAAGLAAGAGYAGHEYAKHHREHKRDSGRAEHHRDFRNSYEEDYPPHSGPPPGAAPYQHPPAAQEYYGAPPPPGPPGGPLGGQGFPPPPGPPPGPGYFAGPGRPGGPSGHNGYTGYRGDENLTGAGVKIPQTSDQNQKQNGSGERGVDAIGGLERWLFASPAASPVQNNTRPLFEPPSPPPPSHTHKPKKDKAPTRSKSVQFDLPSSCDGYESDDNDSASDSDATIDYARRSYSRDRPSAPRPLLLLHPMLLLMRHPATRKDITIPPSPSLIPSPDHNLIQTLPGTIPLHMLGVKPTETLILPLSSLQGLMNMAGQLISHC